MGRECAHVGSIQTGRERCGPMCRTSTARRALGQGVCVCVCVCVVVEVFVLCTFWAPKKPKRKKRSSKKKHAVVLEQHACDLEQRTRDGNAGGVDARGVEWQC
jgi:hypothetical protein